MKYLKLYESNNIEKDYLKSLINIVCEIYRIDNYTINDDYSIDVHGRVDLSNKELYEIPLKFNNIYGDFLINMNNLTSLKNSPKYIEGGFSCYSNDLKSLENCPECTVINFGFNNIKTIEFLNKNIKRIYCESTPFNKIWSLFKDDSNSTYYIEMLNDYKCFSGEDIILYKFNEFLEDIGKNKVESIDGYNII